MISIVKKNKLHIEPDFNAFAANKIFLSMFIENKIYELLDNVARPTMVKPDFFTYSLNLFKNYFEFLKESHSFEKYLCICLSAKAELVQLKNNLDYNSKIHNN